LAAKICHTANQLTNAPESFFYDSLHHVPHSWYIITAPPGGVQSTAMSVSVWVCLSVHSHVSKTADLNFPKFSVCVICGRGFGPSDNAVCYVLLVLWMTSCFHIMGQTKVQA